MSKSLRKLGVTAAAAAAIIGFAGPALADRSLSAGLDSQSTPDLPTVTATVPDINAPGCGRFCPGEVNVNSLAVSTPEIRSINAATDAITFGGRCLNPVACIGGFTVPAIDAATTPHIGSQTVRTPNVSVPNACRLASATSEVCAGLAIDGFTVSQDLPVDSITLTPPIRVTMAWSPVNTWVPAASGQKQYLAPVSATVPVPVIGNIPVTLFPQGLRIPAVAGTSATYNLTVDVHVGDRLFSNTVPVALHV